MLTKVALCCTFWHENTLLLRAPLKMYERKVAGAFKVRYVLKTRNTHEGARHVVSSVRCFLLDIQDVPDDFSVIEKNTVEKAAPSHFRDSALRKEHGLSVYLRIWIFCRRHFLVVLFDARSVQDSDKHVLVAQNFKWW